MSEIFIPPDEVEATSIYNPYSQRAWWNSIQILPLFKQRSNLYERALNYIPGSYKLWWNYLKEARDHASSDASEDDIKSVNDLHERALKTLYLMPRIWLDYLEWLMTQKSITYSRRMFDAALQCLPVTQHDLIWKLYIEFAENLPVAESGRRIMNRYLLFKPDFLENYIDFLERKGFVDECASKYYELIQKEDRNELWMKLADYISKNPDSITLDNVFIIRTALEKVEEKGKIWQLLAEMYIRLGDIDKAREVYEEGMNNVTSARDFGVIYAAYTQFEEELLNEVMEEDPEEAEDSMKRLESLADRRELLLSNVRLRENPHNVEEWLKRVRIFSDDIVGTLRTYAEAVTVVDPVKATGKPQQLWINFARVYEEQGDLKNARLVFFKASQGRYRKLDQLSDIWTEWIEFEIRHRHYQDALILARNVCNRKSNPNHKEATPQEQISMVNSLWSLYLDLEESFGTEEGTISAYSKMINIKLATPQIVMNYANYLEAHDKYEEAFQVYEIGIGAFTWPHIYDIWIAYLVTFMKRYGDQKLERARDLFEQVLSGCPKDRIKIFYYLYAKLEEEHGLFNHVMEIYDRAVKDLPHSEKVEVFNVYMQKACDFYGISKMRTLYESALDPISQPSDIIDLGLKFANIERKLGEIDRVRALYMYLAQYCDPRKEQDKRFWSDWEDFEIFHGNEDTYSEMNRVKRTVMIKYSGVTPFLVENS